MTCFANEVKRKNGRPAEHTSDKQPFANRKNQKNINDVSRQAGNSETAGKPNGLTTNKSTKRSCPGTKAFNPDKTRIFYWACNKLSSVDANGLNHFSRIADAKEAQIRQPDRYACICLLVLILEP